MKKNIVIIILSVVILGLGGYLVYDKVTDKKVKNSNDEVKVENYDLALADELVKKYSANSGFLGGDIFTEGLTDNMKMLIALNNVSVRSIDSFSCDLIYGTGYEKSESGEYFVPLDTTDNISGVCQETVKSIQYSAVNYIHKNLFGSDMQKKDMIIGTYRFDYNEESESYYSLGCNCGGADPTMRFYGVKSAKLNDDELTINVGYSIFIPDDDWKIYTADFDETVTYTAEERSNNENFDEELIEKHLDKMTTYKFTFEKTKDNYILKSVVKE